MMYWTASLIAEAAAQEGGLFDFDATLPLMAIQFLILAAILNATFFKPLGTAIDERDGYIRENQTEARDRLAKAEAVAQQYEAELTSTRRQAQTVIADAQAAAQAMAAEKVAAAQKEAQAKREAAQQELEQQKETAYAALEQQVDELSRQVLDKLLSV